MGLSFLFLILLKIKTKHCAIIIVHGGITIYYFNLITTL